MKSWDFFLSKHTHTYASSFFNCFSQFYSRAEQLTKKKRSIGNDILCQSKWLYDDVIDNIKGIQYYYIKNDVMSITIMYSVLKIYL